MVEITVRVVRVSGASFGVPTKISDHVYLWAYMLFVHQIQRSGPVYNFRIIIPSQSALGTADFVGIFRRNHVVVVCFCSVIRPPLDGRVGGRMNVSDVSMKRRHVIVVAENLLFVSWCTVV